MDIQAARRGIQVSSYGQDIASRSSRKKLAKQGPEATSVGRVAIHGARVEHPLIHPHYISRELRTVQAYVHQSAGHIDLIFQDSSRSKSHTPA